MYLYTAGGTALAAVVPSWASEGGSAKLLERLQDPAIRVRLKKEIKTESPGWWNIVEAAGLVAHAAAVIGLDTGLTHLAAAFSTPVAGVFCDSEPVDAHPAGQGPTA